MEYRSALQSILDDYKPSLFGTFYSSIPLPVPSLLTIPELLSESQLSALIPPSLHYLLALATHRSPRYLLPLHNAFPEVYALLSLALEHHFLKTYCGSFTEHFYGLKRERVLLHLESGTSPRAQLAVPKLIRETHKLDRKLIWKNLAILVGVPYIKRKLDEAYEIYVPRIELMGARYRRDELPNSPSLRQRILWAYKWFLRNVYPSINAAYYFSLLAFNLAYLFSHTHYSSPFLWLIGTRIRRMSAADHQAIAQAMAPVPPSGSGSKATSAAARTSIFSPVAMASVVIPKLLSALRLLLPTSIFALKFLEWWHASDFATQLSRKATENLNLPPPVVAGEVDAPPKPVLRPSAAPEKWSVPSRPTNTVALSSDSPPSSSLSSPPPSEPISFTQNVHQPPMSTLSHLPIFTLPASSHSSATSSTTSTSPLCPICKYPIQTATAVQTGYVFCYTCIYKWVDGTTELQARFMEGSVGWRWVRGKGEKDKESEDEEEGEGKGNWVWDDGLGDGEQGRGVSGDEKGK